jgi:hypothetical protein
MRLLTERAALREDAAMLLGELGWTASEVAFSLYAMGVRHQPSSAGDSPAARYLHAVVGADSRVKQVKVTKRRLALRTHRRLWPTVRVPLPHPVREFVASADGARAKEATDVPVEGNQT